MTGEGNSIYYIEPALDSTLKLAISDETSFSISVPASSGTTSITTISLKSAQESGSYDHPIVVSNIKGTGSIRISSENPIVINNAQIRETQNLVIEPLQETNITLNEVSLYGSSSSISGGSSSTSVNVNQLNCRQTSNTKLINVKIVSELNLELSASVTIQNVDVSESNITFSYSSSYLNQGVISGEIGLAPHTITLRDLSTELSQKYQLFDNEFLLVRSNAFDTCDEWSKSFISEVSIFNVARCRKEDDNIILYATYDIGEDDPDQLQPGAIAGIVIGVVVVVIIVIIIIIAIVRRKKKTRTSSFSVSDSYSSSS